MGNSVGCQFLIDQDSDGALLLFTRFPVENIGLAPTLDKFSKKRAPAHQVNVQIMDQFVMDTKVPPLNFSLV